MFVVRLGEVNRVAGYGNTREEKVMSFILSRMRGWLSGIPSPTGTLPDRQEPVAPAGYQLPVSADTLLAEEGRALRVGQLRQLTGVDEKLFITLYLEPVRACAALMQLFPASERDCHARLGGLLDMTLDNLVFALKHRKAYMLPLNGDVESQSRQTEVWTAATAYSVLFSFLPVLEHLQVEYENGASWHPLQGQLTAPYRFRFVAPMSAMLPERTGLLLGTQLLPAVVPAWFSRFPELYRTFMAVLVGDDTQSGMLRVLVQNGRQEAEKQWRMRYPPSAVAAVASPVPVTVASVPGPLAAGALPVSAPLSPVTVPPVAVQKVASETVMVPAPGTSAPTDPQASAPVALLAGDVLLAAQTAVSDEDAEDSAPSLAVVRTEEETRAIEASLELLAPESLPLSHADDGVHRTRNVLGQAFLDWLCDGIHRGEFLLNTPTSRLHLVAGYLFIPSPFIFTQFAKVAAEGVDLTEQATEWRDVQQQFESLGIHLLTPNRLCQCQLYEGDVSGGRFQRLSGYLIDGKKIFTAPLPANNPLMKITTKR